MNKEELLKWNERYDNDHPWWTQKEKEIGEKLRRTKELTKEDLVQVVEWKFKELKGRRLRVLGLIKGNTEEQYKRVSHKVFISGSDVDSYKIDALCTLDGVGPAIASTILTFYDPKRYCVFDIHIWRELFGKEPANLFVTKNYVKLLFEIRKIASGYNIDARTVEKAFFKKNLEETSN
jgi:hypothetical protein